MLKAFKLQMLYVKRLGANGELLSAQSFFGHKKWLLQSIQMQKNKEAFSLSIPSEFAVSENENKIWSGSASDSLRVSFSWKKMPENLSIELPNKTRMQLSEKSISFFSKESPLRLALPIAAAILVHLGSTLLISLPSSTPARPSLKVSVDLVQTENITKSADAKNSDDNTVAAASMAETKKLLQGLRVGKKKVAIRSPAGTLNSNAFSDKTQISKKTWSIDQAIQESNDAPLNLSEQQIRAALQPAYGKLKECYEDVLIHDSSLKGQPQLRIDVAKSGKISAVNLSFLNAKSESLRDLKECFFKAYQNIRVQNPNRDFQVVHTLVLNY